MALTGPSLSVCAQATQHLALAIHELATNACKYGALCGPTGTVAIEWLLDNRGAAKEFSLRWTEHGGPNVKRPDPDQLGFGTLVLKKLVPSGLNASAELNFAPSGLNWMLHSENAWFCD